MGKILNKLIFGITCLALLFTFAFTSQSTNVLAAVNEDLNAVSYYNLSSDKETDLDVSDIETYYTSYERFIRATDKYDENITFLTVVRYSKRLYQEGIDRLEGTGQFDGYEYVKSIKSSYLEAFYQYWYIQSEFESKTISNISETRPTEIKALYDEILACVDNQDTEGAKTKINSLIDEIYNDALTLDNLGLYAKKIERPEENVVVIDEDADYYLSYNQFIKAKNSDNVKQITYTEVAKQITNLLNEGLRRIEAKESDYYEPFSNSYGYWYETSGFERKTMELISGSRVTAVELQFSSMKSAASGGSSLDVVTAETNKLIDMLKHDAAYLDNLNGYIELKVENNNIYCNLYTLSFCCIIST